MENWDLNDSFDKLGSAYFKSYDETNDNFRLFNIKT